MKNEKLLIAERFANLPAEKRQLFLQALQDKGLNFSKLPIIPRPADAALVLSYAQQRQWFLWQLEPRSNAYHIPTCVRLTGALDPAQLQSSLNALVARHASLRTRFHTDAEGEVRQQVLADLEIELQRVDLRAHSDGEARAQAQIDALLSEPFDLQQVPLLRVALYQLDDQHWLLALVMHHIISDGWSMQLLVDEFIQLYMAGVTGTPAALPALSIQYADYAVWQRNWMEAGERARQLDWWQNLLGDEHPVLALPTDHPRQAEARYRAASVDFELPDSLSDGIRQLAQRQRMTPFMVLLAGFQALLHRHSGQSAIRVGVPVANRNRAEVEHLIGFFVNTQVLPARFESGLTLEGLLAQTRDVAKGAQSHQDLPFDILVDALKLDRSLSYNPLFQVMFNHQEGGQDSTAQLAGLVIEPHTPDSGAAQFDLVLNCTSEASGSISAQLQYARELFAPDTIHRLAGHYQAILQAMISTPAQRVDEVMLLSDAEQQQLQQWGLSLQPEPATRFVHQSVEHYARLQPDREVARQGERTLSWAQLNSRANQLAHYLMAQGIGPEQIVGIAMPRDVDVLVCYLGVLKAGAAYVPLDLAYPAQRLGYMMQDSAMCGVLTLSSIALPEDTGVTPLLFDQLALDDYSRDNPAVRIHPETPAYVIFTSGSTGQPKGVMVAHGAIASHVKALGVEYEKTIDARSLMFMSFSFDGAHECWMTTLTHGGSVVMRGDDLWSVEETCDALHRHGITDVVFPPAFMREVAEWVQATGKRPPVLTYCFGGDAMPKESFELIRTALRPKQFINGYGPTETVVTPLVWRISPEQSFDEGYAPIGGPIGDRCAYILDQHLQPVPVGIPGELYLGTNHALARGYFQRPGLTAERFVPNPFADGGERLYRSGDLVRWRQDGAVDYLGRLDNQIKVRGFRVELGEIEAQIRDQPGVADAVVTAVERKYLAAYWVRTANSPLTDTQLKAQLAAELPDYMVPSAWLELAELPVNANGKVDRNALPAPTFHSSADYVAPEGDIETALADIWQAILKIDQVGRFDNFFELGGHSLSLMQVKSRLQQRMALDIPLNQLFARPVFSELAAVLALALASTEHTANAVPAIAPRSADVPALLSYAQQRQWFLWQLDPASNAYHIPAALRLDGPLDVEALRDSFNALVARHDALRTVFSDVNGQAVQQILPSLSLDIPCLDLRGQVDAEHQVQQLMQVLVAEPFDLQQGPLLRIGLYQIADDQHRLALVMHHIISDDWSVQVMVDEFVQHYQARVNGDEATLPALPIQYADYAVWQRDWMDAGERERQLGWWQGLLGDDHPVLALPTDHPRAAQPNYSAATHSITLPAALTSALKTLAQQRSMTPFMLLLAGFQALLYRYSGQSNIRVGVPIANRNRLEVERLIGFFVNTQVLPAQFAHGQSLAQLLDQVKDTALGAQAHQDLPFDILVDALQLDRSLSLNPLFQVMFNHLGAGTEQLKQLSGLTVSALEQDAGSAQFELTLDTFEDADGGLDATFTYARELFEPATIERMAGHYQALLQAMVEDAAQPLSEVALLSDTEQQQLQCWGHNDQTFPADEQVHRLFEQQVVAAPERTALIFEDQQLSYGGLNRRANQLAHQLIALGVGPDVRVGMAVERSVEMIVSLLAVLKAGGAYVPLDPSYPRERLGHMIDQSGMRLILSQSWLADSLPLTDAHQLIELDKIDLSAQPGHNPDVRLHGDNLAYVIYTSGSTGKPKGVGIAHQALARHSRVSMDFFNLTADDRMLQFATVNFDAFADQFWPPLCCGAAIVLRGPELWDSEVFYRHLLDDRISVADLTPAYWYPLIQAFVQRGYRDYGALRRMHIGGEAMPPKSLQMWREAGLAGVQLFNLYGPTEATVTATAQDCQPWIDGTRALPNQMPIGQALGERQLYVLDTQLNVVPQGVAGELYIGGDLLARGYIDQPTLSAERFIANPFDNNGGRLYRTGDLVRWLDGGELEYLGRTDHQVKIRGLRIELGEIEAALLAHPEVGNAMVVAQQGGSSARLVAYVVAESGRQLDLTALKTQLSDQLPDYMVPATLMLLDAMPLTPGGKINHHALPEPALATDTAYEAPQGELETALAEIWQAVLKVDQVGRLDNFFELGGDSILSLQIVSRARQAGWTLTPKQVFERQTLAELAPVMQRADTEQQRAGTAPMHGEVALLPIQADFFAQPLVNPHHLNQAVLLRSEAAIDVAALRQALQALVQHHDALRMAYRQTDSCRWTQTAGADVDGQALLWLRQADSADAITALCDAAQRSLNIVQGPLLRVVLIEVADGSSRLLLAIHHLVVDGVSWRVLLEDLQTAYQQCCAQQAIQLPGRTSSVQAWGQRLQQYALSPACQAQHEYWLAQGQYPVQLPCDNPQGAATEADSVSLDFMLDAEQTGRLLSQAPVAYRTRINDLLLTALGRALCRWSGHSQIQIDLEGHGREDLFDDIDLSRTVGWFTSLFPVGLSPQGDLATAIKATKEQLRKIPDNGLGYGVLKYLGDAEIQQQLRGLPRSQIVFNYLGQFDGSFDEDAALWQPAAESSGRDIDAQTALEHALSINGQVFEGQLQLNWSFSGQRYQSVTIQRVIDLFGEELTQLIDHCCSGVSGLTPSDVPLAEVSQVELDQLPVPVAELADLYPLSPMQQGMLFHSLMDQQGQAYISQVQVAIRGLDVDRFHSAWQAVLARHDILRTGFITVGDRQQQWVRKTVELPFSLMMLNADEVADQPAQLAALARSELAAGFDLARPPLMKLALVDTGLQQHHLIWTLHHLLVDGWSTAQLMGEALSLYHGVTLPPAQGQYRNYISWLQYCDDSESQRYWKSQLAQLDTPTWLANALPTPESAEQQAGTFGHLGFELSPADTAQLNEFARQQKVTINTLVQGAWLLLLQRYTGQASVCVGTVVAGRPTELANADQMLGLFINTQPLISRPDACQALGDWLRDLQTQNLAMREHEHVPLFEIQRWAGQGAQGLFDTLMVFENYPVDEALQQESSDALQLSVVGGHEETNYPLTLTLSQADTLSCQFSYERCAFSERSLQKLSTHLRQLLLHMKQSEQRLADIPLLREPEQQQLQAWGYNTQTFPADEQVHRLFEQQVTNGPDRLALIFEDQQLSYSSLNRRANQLAHYLIAKGVGPDVSVGMAVERSVEMIVSLLAVLKAGGAYVPLDPSYPRERLGHMIAQSGMQLILSQSALRDSLPLAAGHQLITLDKIDLSLQPDYNPDVRLHGDNLAYVIYTSGSTGKPKGVGIPHHALARHSRVSMDFFNLTMDDRMLQFATVNFDGFVEQMYPPLCCGAAIVLRGPDLWDSETLYRHLRIDGITVGHLTTAYWFQAIQYFVQQGYRDYGVLRQLHIGGEAMPPDGAQIWRDAGLSHVTLLNTYGPTEATVTATELDCQPWVNGTLALPNQMPIGRALGERQLYVLDGQLNLVPQSVIGELCIGGDLLARGYIDLPALSAERFIANPFADDGGRLYRTGDLVRWLESGELEYLGRKDHQVKIRGLRIELGEIEAALLAYEDVGNAIVIAHEGGLSAGLVAYVVPKAGGMLQPANVKAHLSDQLPEYMVPAVIMVLDGMPLTPGGKVDRNALPAPKMAMSHAYVAPEGEVEQALATIWQDLLKLERVGRHDNFFELGGHSIICLQVISRVRNCEQIPLEIRLGDLMQYPTIAGITARFLGQNSIGQAPSPLLSLNRTAPDLPMLFCVHGGFGTAFDFRPLAERLEGRHAVWALQSRMLLDNDWVDHSMEQMAHDYVDAIRQQQPNGPYRLMGWSFGGILAIMMTALLEEQGESVEWLGLVDIDVPSEREVVVPGSEQQLLSELRGFIIGTLADTDLDPDLLETIADAIGGVITDGHSLNQSTVQRALQQVIDSLAGDNLGFMALGAAQLSRNFMAYWQLSLIVDQLTALPSIRTATSEWWVEGKDIERQRLRKLPDYRCAQMLEVGNDHMTIMQEAGFIESLESWVNALPPR